MSHKYIIRIIIKKMFEREEAVLFDTRRLYQLDESQYYNIEN